MGSLFFREAPWHSLANLKISKLEMRRNGMKMRIRSLDCIVEVVEHDAMHAFPLASDDEQ
jgi:hypothetical protein